MCGSVLDEKTAKFRINFESETYYFCSVSCKKKFKRHPKKFERLRGSESTALISDKSASERVSEPCALTSLVNLVL